MDPSELGSRSAIPITLAEHTISSSGLTKRESAAFVAMHGMLAAGAADIDDVTEVAVAYADRLIELLAKEPTP
jgi:hypothetical protein